MTEASDSLPEDIMVGVGKSTAKNDIGFLYKHKRGITGKLPVDRNGFDPAHVLNIAPGGRKVIKMDSNQLPDNWTEEDINALVTKLRKPRTCPGTEEMTSGSEGSAGSSQGSLGSDSDQVRFKYSLKMGINGAPI